jgi:TRAP-type C4-dicarboxylate transport system substrate-binding protein
MKVKLLAALALGLSFSATAQAQTTLRLLNSFDGRYAGTPLIVEPLVKAVKEASKGDLNLVIHGPEVVTPFEQFQPVSQGAFDLLFTVQPYHIGTTSVSMGVYALSPDPVKWRQVGVFDHVDKEYQRHNLKLLAMIPATTPGVGAFQLLLKEPMAPGDKPLNGRKIRGNANFKPMLEAMGGSSVTLAGGEIYSALQRGVVEGVSWPVIGAVDFKWYEVATYMTRPTFGSSVHFLLMNLNKYNALSATQKATLLAEAEKTELSGQKVLEERLNKEIVDLKKLGVKETTLDPAAAAKFYKLFNEAFWQSAEESKATGEQAKAFRAFARSKGLTE